MHFWGDNWFKEHGDDLYSAIDEIEAGLHKHHIGVCGKEKWGCFNDTTEVLTKSGWKIVKDVSKEDLVATLNPDSGFLEYQNPTNIIQYHYKGDMYYLSNRGVDIFCTDNHNLYVAKGSYTKKGIKHTYPFELIDTKKYYRKDKRFKKGCLWEGVEPESEFLLPSYMREDYASGDKKTFVRHTTVPEFHCDMKAFLRFLGFYIAEGFVVPNKEGKKPRNSVYVTYNEADEENLVCSLLDGINVSYYNTNKNTKSFSSIQLSSWLLENCGHLAYNKKVPDFIKDLPPEYIELFLTYLFIGDGHKDKTSNVLCTTSKRLCDDVCELLLKAGYTFSCNKRDRTRESGKIQSRHVEYDVSWLKLTEVEIDMSKVDSGKVKSYKEEYVPFDGQVYCVTVPNHIIYIRRNGKGVWIGNCYRDDFLRFWDGGLYDILFGYRAYIGSFGHKGLFKFKWFKKFVDKIHHYIYFRIDKGTPWKYMSQEASKKADLEEYKKAYEKRWWKGLCYYNDKIGLTKKVNDRLAEKLNMVFQQVCAKYPDIVDELISDVTCYHLIKPCKWGNVDGKAIHDKHWVRLEPPKPKEENNEKNEGTEGAGEADSSDS